MARVFFKIGTLDLTPFTDIQNISINAVEVADEWEDANHQLHRYVFRTRNQGGVNLAFEHVADYNAFLAAMSSQRVTSGSLVNTYPVTSWVANAGSATVEAQYNAFVETVGSAKWDVVNGRQLITQELTVREA